MNGTQAKHQKLRESLDCFPRALREFLRVGGLDAAAALSYFLVLAMFPGLLAMISLLSLAGASEGGSQWIMDLLERSMSPNGEPLQGDAQQLLDTARQLLDGLASEASGTTVAILIGSLGAIWSTSGYVQAFSRAMNRMYGVQEGRPSWKRRPQMFMITLMMMLVAVISLVFLVTSGSIARGLGSLIGLGDNFVTLWNWAKPPIMLVMFLLILALLYYLTPNVKRERFRWFSPGTLTALTTLVLAVLGFGFYLTRFASYSATYGAIGGVIVLVLAGWISNIALLYGAMVDIEFARLRQLRAGIPAAEHLQLPVRDDTQIRKQEFGEHKDNANAQNIMVEHGGDPLMRLSWEEPRDSGKRKTRWLPVAVALAAGWGFTRWSRAKHTSRKHSPGERD